MSRLNLIKASLVCVLSSSLLVACGGGGGGSSTPDSVRYLAVSSTQPISNAHNVDARNREITASFSASVDPLSLGNLQSSVGTLLTSQGYGVVTASNLEPASTSGLTLGDLVSGEYHISLVNSDGSEEIITAVSYEFVEEATGFALQLNLDTTGQNIYFSAAEVKSSGIVDNSAFKVTTGAGLTAVQGSLAVSGSKITFRPVKFLEWSSTYTVTVSQSIKDTQGRNLKTAYSWSFSTTDIPDAAIESVSPLSIEANPLKDIRAMPNFVADPITLQSGNVVLRKLIRVSADEEPTREDVAANVSWDPNANEIIINPDSDLEYLQEYEVTIKGDPNGVTGSLGNVAIGLPQDYVWEFTTGAPALLEYSPNIEDSGSPVVERDATIELTLNFRPNPAQIGSSIFITDQNGVDIPYMFEISGDHEDVVTLTPLSLLDYNTTFSVELQTSLNDRNVPSVTLAEETRFSFTSVRRKVIDRTPGVATTSAELDTLITVTFNFDVAAGAFSDRSHYQIERRVDFGPWEEVPGSASYANRVMTFTPTELFLYNETVRVTIYNTLPSVDGASIYQQHQWSFDTRNENLTIISSSPYDNETDVPFDTPIWIQLSSDIDQSTLPTFDSLEVEDCGYSNMSGSVQVDGDTLYFLPSEDFDSWCNYRVTVDSGIRGTLNEQQSYENYIEFTTDGLEVWGAYVTYAYGDYVDIGSDIEIDFNYPVDYVFSGDIYLEDENGWTVSGTTYRSGNTVEFDPTFSLDYGSEYTLVVTTDVEGTLGEELRSEYRVSFITENLPVDVYDYGPTGYDVYVDDEFWVQMTEYTDEPGFPYYDADISPYESFSLSEWGDTIYLTPTFDLDYNTDYAIDFEFDFPNGYEDDFSFGWDITTEQEYIASSSMAMSAPAQKSVQLAQSLAPMSTAQRRTAPANKVRGCRAQKDCKVRLKTRSIEEYKESLAAHRRGSLESAQASMAQMRTRKEIQRIRAAEKKLGLGQ